MDIYSPQYLAGIVADLKRTPRSILSRYFPTVRTFSTEEVTVDVMDRRRRVAPFVSPYVRGKAVNSQGFASRSIKPAYVKDERPFTPDRAFKRVAGEQIGGSYTPEERMNLALAADMDDQISMIDRREEVMAVEQLRTGKLVIVGEEYPTVTVDLQRPADQTIDLTDGEPEHTPWDQNGSDPLADLKDWALNLVKKRSGVYPRDVIMGVDAFETFVSHAKVEKRWQAQNANLINIALKTGDALEEDLTYMGAIEGFSVYVYADWYIDPLDNEEKEILPANEVILCSQQVQGVRNYGAIRDLQSLKPEQYFPKMYEENNPSVLYLLMQSAPLPAMERPGGSVGAKVKAAA